MKVPLKPAVPRTKLLSVSALLVLWVFITALAARIVLDERNVLSRYAQWSSSKCELEKDVVGESFFLTTRPALLHNELNLGAWHGYNELVYREPFTTGRIVANFRLGVNAHFSLIFGKSRNGFSAVRISGYKRRPSAILTVSAAGKFLEKRRLDHAEPPEWNLLELSVSKDEVVVTLNGEELARKRQAALPGGALALRAGSGGVSVKSLEIFREETGDWILEKFSGADRPWPVYLAVVLVLLLTNFLVSSLNREGLPALLWINALIFLGVVARLGFDLYTAAYAPYPAHPKGSPICYSGDLPDASSYKTFDPGTAATHRLKIALLGGSQTWGAGASRVASSWPNRLAARLNERALVLNYGGPGAMSGLSLNSLVDHGVVPDLIIANISNNDSTETLRETLGALAAFCRRNKVKAMLSLEPNSSDGGGALDIRARHDLMRAVSGREGFGLVDEQGFFESDAVYDSGYLWWDYVHLTDFGQELFLEYLWSHLLRFEPRLR